MRAKVMVFSDISRFFNKDSFLFLIFSQISLYLCGKITIQQIVAQ